jgi:hypothetical protein
LLAVLFHVASSNFLFACECLLLVAGVKVLAQRFNFLLGDKSGDSGGDRGGDSGGGDSGVTLTLTVGTMVTASRVVTGGGWVTVVAPVVVSG